MRPAPLLIRFGAAGSFLAARIRKVSLAVTPGYSAPELHFSDEKAHGPLCDIFSLAAVLYFVVTGRHPINVIARGLGHTMPPAAAMPSQRFRNEFLEAIDRGLELDPERRPPTIEAFGKMLFAVPQRKASENAEPASELTANLAEGYRSTAKILPLLIIQRTVRTPTPKMRTLILTTLGTPGPNGTGRGSERLSALWRCCRL